MTPVSPSLRTRDHPLGPCTPFCLRARYRPGGVDSTTGDRTRPAPYRASALEAWAALAVAPVVVGMIVLGLVAVAGLLTWWEE